MDNLSIIQNAANGYITVNSGSECLANKVNVNEIGTLEEYLNNFNRPSLTVIVYKANGKTPNGTQNFRKIYSGTWEKEDSFSGTEFQDTPQEVANYPTPSPTNSNMSDVLQLRIEMLTKENTKLEKLNDKLSSEYEQLYKQHRSLKEDVAVVKREHEISIREIKQEHRFELEKLERDNSNSLGTVASNLLTAENIKSILPVIATAFGRVPAALPESTDSSLSDKHNTLISKINESFRQIDEEHMCMIYDVVSAIYQSEFQLAKQILNR